MKRQCDFVGIGFCSNDYLCVLPEIPLDSKVKIITHLIQGGGPSATSTVAAARLGVSAGYVSVTGDDDAGKRIRDDLAAEKVDVSSMIVRKNATSAIAYCWVEEKTGKRSVAWSRGSAAELEAEETDLELVRHAKILHLDGHNPKAAIRASQEARKAGVLINFDAGTYRDGFEELAGLCDLFITSEEIARKLTGETDLRKALAKLAERGRPVTGLTMGSEGSMMWDNGKILVCPAFSVPVVDTTGAGDVFHASFAIRYQETHDLMESMRFGSAVSALKCGKLGGRTGIPTRSEVETFLRTH